MNLTLVEILLLILLIFKFINNFILNFQILGTYKQKNVYEFSSSK